jgi:hypothetical protein
MRQTVRILLSILLLTGVGCSSTPGVGDEESNVTAGGSPGTGGNTGGDNPTTGGAIIADHTAADAFDSIPDQYLTAAKEMFRMMYSHTSHGSQIISGMEWLRDRLGSAYDYSYTYGYWACTDDNVFLCDKTPGGDLGSSTWEPDTREGLDTHYTERNVVMWSWCGQVSGASQDYIQTYLSSMDGLIADYADIPFIFMTGHLDGSGPTGNLYVRNNQIRQHVRDTNGILFDFADIESYDPAGNYYPDGSDACQWCTSWCASHPADCQNLPECAHSHGFNCVRKAKAFWWMMARLAGWNGSN